MAEYFTAAELAAQKLMILPGTERGVQLLAAREDWEFRERKGRGGGREYPISALPPAARAQLLAKTGKALAPVPAAAHADASSLKQWRRSVMEARLAILQEVERIAAGSSLNKAIEAVTALASIGELAPGLQELVAVANARAGGERSSRILSRRTILRWRKLHTRGGLALAPLPSKREAPVPEWGAALLRLWAQPQKPMLPAVIERLAVERAGQSMPTPGQARRFLAKMSVIERNRGRMGPRELKSLRAFRRRDVSELMPLELVLVDGHTFDAEIAHPLTGKPFRPEMTTIIDAATRKAVGWSAALAESGLAVMRALRVCIMYHGVPLILYCDRGSAYEGEMIGGENVGLLARFGIRHETALPYNSQARGLIERLHQTLWVRAAKKLPTFIGADMDPEAKKKVFKLTRANVVPFSPPIAKPWVDFVGWANDELAAYNARPHRSLPKIRDEATGKMRHQSPNEAWERFLVEGWAPHLITEEEARDAFLPVAERVTRRGEIQIGSNLYFNRDLEHRHGERVQVSYDPINPQRVWVKDLEGRFLCTAELDGNKVGFFPKSMIEQLREKRVAAAIHRLDQHREAKEAELSARLIEASDTVHDADAVTPAAVEREEMPEPIAPPRVQVSGPRKLEDIPIDPDGRPHFRADDDHAWLEWCLGDRSRITQNDLDLLMPIMRSSNLRELYGISDEVALSFGVSVRKGENDA